MIAPQPHLDRPGHPHQRNIPVARAVAAQRIQRAFYQALDDQFVKSRGDDRHPHVARIQFAAYRFYVLHIWFRIVLR